MKHDTIFGVRYPTLLLLHGWTSLPETKQKWQPFVQALEKIGCPVVFLPLPGLTAPLEESWDLDAYVTWLESKVVKYSSYIVLGHSFGGQIATKFSSRNQVGQRGLILVDSSGIPDRRIKSKLKRWTFFLLAKVGKQIPFAHTCKPLLYRLARERDYISATPKQKTTMRKVIREDLSKIAQMISVPTLLIWGAKDATTPIAMAQELLRYIPNSRLAVIEGARHSPQYTHVEAVVANIKKWLEHHFAE